MNFEQLKDEFFKTLALYDEECLKNGNREGSTLAYALRTELTLLQHLGEKYFSMWLAFDRHF